MLDINFIKENKDKVKEAIKNKRLEGTIDIENLLAVYDNYSNLLKKVEEERGLRNKISNEVAKAKSSEKEKIIEQAKVIKEELQKLEKNLENYRSKLDDLMLWVPNIPAEDVPVGEDEGGNVEVRKVGKVKSLGFEPKDHIELGKTLDIIDVDRGAKISGFRGYFLKNEGAVLEQAILKYAYDFMIKQGFTFMGVPWMVNPGFFVGTGYFPWGVEDHYKVDEKALIGTSEVSLTSYYAGEILNEKDLPVKLIALSPCFRREIGAYGKDTKGVFRVHQFYKVEQVVLCENDEGVSREWHEKMLGYSENILKNLGLPYRVVLMCTGDMGAGQRKKYDIETWFPSQKDYRETHSDSYFLDFQSRRLNIRYRAKNGDLKFVHTLNNTVAATPRLLAAVLESYQQKDGSVLIPKVLRKYTGFKKIKPKD